MKQFFSKYKRFVIGGAIVFFMLIPLGINGLYKLPAPFSVFSAEWSAGDALSFYGAILTAIIGVVGVYWSIQAAQANYREDERNKVKPYFAVSHISSKASYDVMHLPEQIAKDEIENTNIAYKEFRTDKYYAIIEESGVTVTSALDKEKERLLHYGCKIETRTTSSGREKSYKSVKYTSIPLEIENVGNGAAVAFNVGVYPSENITDEKYPYFTIPTSHKVFLHIYSEWKNINGEYAIDFQYRDILGNWYRQIYHICFKENEQIFDLEGSQKSITEEELNEQAKSRNS